MKKLIYTIFTFLMLIETSSFAALTARCEIANDRTNDITITSRYVCCLHPVWGPPPIPLWVYAGTLSSESNPWDVCRDRAGKDARTNSTCSIAGTNIFQRGGTLPSTCTTP